MTRITKNELIAINSMLSTECAALRAELSALRVTVQTHAPTQRPTRVHAYADRAEAVAACKRCASSEANKRWTFVVVNNTVVASARTW